MRVGPTSVLVPFLAALAASGCIAAPDAAWLEMEGAADRPRKCVLQSETPIDPATLPVQGFDVSVHQRHVDWDAVREAGKTFAIARVSDGLYTEDGDLFVENYQGIARAGLLRGAYQFLRPEQDATLQANLFLAALTAAGGLAPGDLPPIVDIEVENARHTGAPVSNEQVQRAVQSWLDVVGAATGTSPMVYTMAGRSASVGTGFGEHRLWVANFYQDCPRMPAGWADLDFFQYTDLGRLPGIGTTVDLDVFNGTREQLDELIALRGYRPAPVEEVAPETIPGEEPAE
jgi:GH25 family lysozyme M1 (1,4-beta-N-acetylmuramidase)